MKNKIYNILSKNNNEFSQDELREINDLIKQYGGTIQELKYYIRTLELENEGSRLNKAVERNTISYKLGKSIIDAAKRKTTLRTLGRELYSIYGDALSRKNSGLENTKLFHKIIILLNEQKKNEIIEQKKTKNVKPNKVVAKNSEYTFKKTINFNVDRKLNKKSLSDTLINEADLTKAFLEKRVKIAAIMDEFTSFCFDPEADFLHLTPDNWEMEVDSFKPDLLFIESAWKGKDDLWKLKVSQCSEDLQLLIDGCNERGIKTVFWSKEDPVHFGTFLEVAKKVDVVFTTDIDCIQKYKKHINHNDVFLLPFAAQPELHNPIELYERKNKFNFAGSYYLKYPRRQRDFEVLSNVAKNTKGLDIFDRNFNKPHPHYKFPQRFEPMILGSLAPHEIDKAYKGYHYGINMNTIKQSQTMFARRVFEMLASNTIVMSNYSRGVRLIFGDLVICSDDGNELTRQLEKLDFDSTAREKFKLQGLRHVLKDHTYKHRLKYILQKTFNVSLDTEELSTTVISYIRNKHEYSKLIESYERQGLANKHLIVLSEITLNRSSKQDVRVFNTKEEFFKIINQLPNESSIAVFNPDDSYGKHYLSDFVLSYSYLPSDSEEGVRLTKSSYFENSNEVLSLVQGSVYKHVNHLNLSRSLFKIGDFKTNIISKIELHNINDAKVEMKAFSTDSFSYVLNGSKLNERALDLAHEDLTIDEGVDFLNKLLPLSESIQGSNGTTELTEKISMHTLVSNTNKCIEVTELENKFHIKSSLPTKQHRYIKLLNRLPLTGVSKVCTHIDIQASNSIELVFEYFDSKSQKISFEIKEYAPSITIDNTSNSAFMSISIRVNGSNDLFLGSELQLQIIDSAISIESKHQDLNTFTFSAAEIDKQLVRPKSKQIAIELKNEVTELKSTLPDDKFAYIYFKTIYNRDDINLKLNSHYTVESESNFDIRQVFIFLDKNKEKIAHSIVRIEADSTMPIPDNCEFIKIGYKLTGSGTAQIKSLNIGESFEIVNTLIGKSDSIVLARQYPSYEDLYKYGFLHSRLKAYKNNGLSTDMYKLSNEVKLTGFREFESIDVYEGSSDTLKNTLLSGQYKRILVHFIDQKIWEIIKDFKDTIEIYIWVHGAEIQTWQRREFEFERMSKTEIERQKRLSNHRVKFWQNVIDNDLTSNVNFIFVSEYFLQESEEGLNRKFPRNKVSIIHNYIDRDQFEYKSKNINQRFNMLSIRPYASRKYANDLTVKTIIELSKHPAFEKMTFKLYGDGELFEEITEPLKDFKNVMLHKGFLSHTEISTAHKENGIFITPTRMDSQGVSRDEAMSSGLVPVTTAVTAIPEFVDDSCGIVAEGEDYKAMAKGIISLVENPDMFKRLSKAASKRTQSQSGFENTIAKEIDLIK